MDLTGGLDIVEDMAAHGAMKENVGQIQHKTIKFQTQVNMVTSTITLTRIVGDVQGDALPLRGSGTGVYMTTLESLLLVEKIETTINFTVDTIPHNLVGDFTWVEDVQGDTTGARRHYQNE